ncbi:MAG: hypothetical protein L0332_09600 [Chloroflexi bacterium]|nr:hypothetical protein [Chloroflexota bacterium]MCI0581002.1 hypothetical protein [Chloroflexota bacterium]MCI0646341.1 hypothetical protein [Chloroflexota bacterium]MCI0726961.1 hypothetical protein [Chloroflexota bacterium]
MPEANYQVGETFHVQFVWRLPEGDFLRAIFTAEVLHRDFVSDKYVVRLAEFVAGRQEAADGTMRPEAELSRDYWAMVGRLPGRKISLAFEAGDGRPLWLRLATLTGEHNFFSRLNRPE